MTRQAWTLQRESLPQPATIGPGDVFVFGRLDRRGRRIQLLTEVRPHGGTIDHVYLVESRAGFPSAFYTTGGPAPKETA